VSPEAEVKRFTKGKNLSLLTEEMRNPLQQGVKGTNGERTPFFREEDP